ncbi:hypothetical protein AKJ50_00135 [candidate division MSBL1 archaeon SCGC-AAA382A13]|uniref:DUF5615 domain-containing protein n=1 Tax=candidate division MSBL1 archaeon SCGC-AAA382A13 TaxID=1698279 RepID=A0A133VGX1_9EURY|nr:hypothetical protein AKJ50_00135 [candidate division MSBL1 archaeon SCGC-AAA382A13]
MGKVKILADENVRREVVAILKNLEVNIEHVSEAGRRGLSDKKQLEYANKKGRAVLTHDADFTQISEKTENKGVIYVTKPVSAKREAKEVLDVVDSYEPKEIENLIIFVPQS